MNEMISVTLPYYQWRLLISGASALKKKLQKEFEKSDFVPAPGKLNSTEVKVNGLREAIQTISKELKTNDHQEEVAKLEEEYWRNSIKVCACGFRRELCGPSRCHK